MSFDTSSALGIGGGGFRNLAGTTRAGSDGGSFLPQAEKPSRSTPRATAERRYGERSIVMFS